MLVHFPSSPVVVVPVGCEALDVHPYAIIPLPVSRDFPVNVTLLVVDVVFRVKLIFGAVVSPILISILISILFLFTFPA